MVHVTIVALGMLAAVAVTLAQPTADSALSLPGRNKTPEQQCQDRQAGRPSGLCKITNADKWCPELICADKRGDIPLEVKTGRALDGTWCGVRKMCLNGACVDDAQSSGNTLTQTEVNCTPMESDGDDEFEINI